MLVIDFDPGSAMLYGKRSLRWRVDPEGSAFATHCNALQACRAPAGDTA
jgi:hypothetical protein